MNTVPARGFPWFRSRSRIAAAIVAVLLSATFLRLRSGDVDKPEPNTAFTSAVLDRYSPGSRFGKPIDWLGAGEAVETLDRESLGFAVKTVAKPGDGISKVHVWAPRESDGGPTDSLVADRFAFSVDLPIERQGPPYQITAVVDSLFGSRAEPRCASGRDGSTYRVFIWEKESGGGANFSMKTDVRQLQSPEGGLIVYPAGVSAREALEPLQLRPCPGL